MSESENNKRNHKGANEAEGSPEQGESLWGRCYEICIGAKLDASWSEWFEGLEMQPFGEKWTKLCGRVADQAALLGILNKLCRLNLPLVSVNEIKGKPECQDVDPEGGE